MYNWFALNNLLTTGDYNIEYSFIKLYSVALSDGAIARIINNIDIDMKTTHLLVYFDFRAFYKSDYYEIINGTNQNSISSLYITENYNQQRTGTLISSTIKCYEDCIEACLTTAGCIAYSYNKVTGYCDLLSGGSTFTANTNSINGNYGTFNMTDGISKSSGTVITSSKQNCSDKTYYNVVTDTCDPKKYFALANAETNVFSPFNGSINTTEFAFETWIYVGALNNVSVQNLVTSSDAPTPLKITIQPTINLVRVEIQGVVIITTTNSLSANSWNYVGFSVVNYPQSYNMILDNITTKEIIGPIITSSLLSLVIINYNL